ncbi:ABC transporter substrate-binding protein [Roseomonas sp. GC11]|uniref:ABC transporter substrate-binding protein n=1 Tax=Roseomonas sp. GC11 TaxID=2950546 RepID=UPI002108EF16|nr:ABC transporter substrate-binding protein [Roseomonas sp. GC11]MCQ4160353.1 ABC transporter substrate-binding protein [Roseomonas sp. GC11]
MTLSRRAILGGAALALGTPALVRAQLPVLKVGSTPTGVPFTFLDTKSNTITGFMVDLITAIGKDQGFGVEVQSTPFAALIPSLTTSRIDIIAAAMTATPARREQIDFSEPVYAYGEGAVVKEGESLPGTSMAALKGLSAGAQLGTTYAEAAKNAGLDVRTYDSVADIIRDVSLGRIKVGFGDGPIVGYQIGQGVFRGVRLLPGYKPSVVGSINIGTRKGDPVMARINAGLARLIGDGTVQRLIETWNLPPAVQG